MNMDDRVFELVARWSAARDRGETLSVEQLCQSCPELADEVRGRIKMLEAMHWLDAADDGSASPELRRVHPSTHDFVNEATIGLVPASERGAPAIGSLVRYVGDYELLAEIARGGMGIVFKARQVRLKRVVALKMILAGRLASEQEVRRFQTEAEAAAHLEHPHIVPIFEVGEQKGLHYFSMGYVDGPSLASRLVGGPLPAREAATMLRSVAKAVHYAHEKGVIHRDLKPGNILIDKQGEPRVTDFGLAKRISVDASEMTGTGQILGTASYMPPEQALGQPGLVREPADIYALGAVLYAMLTGRPPFQADSPVETLRQVLEREPVPPRQLNPSIPVDLETICLKCLEKNSSRRYITARLVADELGRFLDGKPIHARPVSSLNRVWRWAMRNRFVASLLTLIALLLLGIAIGSSMLSWRMSILAGNESIAKRQAVTREIEERKAKEQAKSAELKERAAKQDAQTERDRVRRALSRQYVSKGEDALLINSNSNSVFEALAWWVKALELDAGDPEREPLHRLRLANLLRTIPRPTGMYFHDAPLSSADWSPDGKYLVTAGYDNVAKVWDAATGRQIGQDMRHDDYIYVAKFSPDGKMIATGSQDCTARVWNALTGEPLTAPLKHSERVGSLAFSPDGKKLATAGKDLGLFLPRGVKRPVFRASNPELPSTGVWDIATGKATQLAKHSAQDMILFFPDGERAASADDYAISIWNAHSGERLGASLQSTGERFDCMGISPDGRYLAASMRVGYNDPGEILCWDVEAGTKIPRDAQMLIALASDENLLIRPYTQRDNRKRMLALHLGADRHFALTPQFTIDKVTYGSDITPRLRSSLGLSTVNSFSPDGWEAILAFDDQPAIRWGFVHQAPRIPPLNCEPGASFQHARYSDDRHVLTVASGRYVQRWDASDGSLLAQRGDLTSLPCYSFAIDAAGRRLVAASGDRLLFFDSDTLSSTSPPLESGRVEIVNISPNGEFFGESRLYPEAYHLGTGGEHESLSIFKSGSRERMWRTEQSPRFEFCPNDRYLAALDRQGIVVRFLAISSGKELGRTETHAAVGIRMVLNSTGTRVLTGCADGGLRMFEAPSGILQWQNFAEGWITDIAYSHDTSFISACAKDGRLHVYDAMTGQLRFQRSHGMHGIPNKCAISRDGRFVATLTPQSLLVWDATSGELVAGPFRFNDDLRYVEFRADGRQLLVQSAKCVRLIDFGEGAPLDPRVPTEAWSAIARIVYPYNLNSSGEEIRLSPAERRLAWETAQRLAPDALATSMEQRHAWMRHDLLAASTHPIDSLGDINTLLASESASKELKATRIELLEQTGRGDDATREALHELERGAATKYIVEISMRRSRHATKKEVLRLDSAIALEPSNPYLLYSRGLLHLHRLAWKESQADAEAANRFFNRPEFDALLTRALAEQDQLGPALEAVERARHGPMFPNELREYHLLLLEATAKTAELEQVRKKYAQLVIWSEFAPPLALLRVEVDQLATQQAEQARYRTPRILPGLPGALDFRNGDLPKATAALRTAIAQDVDTLQTIPRIYLAMTLHKQGDAAGAKAELDAAIAIRDKRLNQMKNFDAAKLKDDESPQNAYWPWIERRETELLLKEAEQTVRKN